MNEPQQHMSLLQSGFAVHMCVKEQHRALLRELLKATRRSWRVRQQSWRAPAPCQCYETTSRLGCTITSTLVWCLK